MANLRNAYELIFQLDDGGWWIVTVKGMAGCQTQGKTLATARKRIKEALDLFLDKKVSPKATFVEKFDLPKRAMKDLNSCIASAEAFEELQATRRKATRRAAFSLTDAGVSLRDAGDMLGMSGARVQQILSE